MVAGAVFELPLRRQVLGRDAEGLAVWRPAVTAVRWPARETALVLCDVWDRHWCRGAQLRLERLLPRMQRVAAALREQGTLIVHAPSETMAFYEGSPARRRVQQAPRRPSVPQTAGEERPSPQPAREERPSQQPACEAPAPTPRPGEDPPLPVDASDGGCDADQEPPRPPWPWSRQHPAIAVDEDRDAVSDDGQEHAALFQQRGIAHVLLMGVHTNMCVLNRSFAIKALVRRGVEVALLRDLTDAMYNPARPPYVSHEEGTRLVIEYIEKFWCPTVASAEVLGE